MRMLLGSSILRIICAVAVSCLINTGGLKNLYSNTLLYTDGQMVEGVLVACEEHFEEGEYSDADYSSYKYEFRDEQGLLVEAEQSQRGTNTLDLNIRDCPCPVSVVYLASDTDISSLKHFVPNSLSGFVWQSGVLRAAVSLALYALVVYFALTYFSRTASH